ncbi:hypothetical protein [Arthrobacter sp. zg-Y919]|uniref:hypothetical protein n=1 Tax=Arthrobacter sp. zg-Y919 TaxID=2894187 RepID=UPI0032E3A68A
MTDDPVRPEEAGEPGAAAQPQAPGPSAAPRRRGNRRAVSAGPAGVLPVSAKEDNPRAWGAPPEDTEDTGDTESWLREQRPPHWE